MFFKEIPIQVWRLQAAVDNVSDPVYVPTHILYGGVQPFTGDEALHAGQAMENIRDIIFFLDPDTDILKSDELVYDGTNRRVAYIQRFEQGILEHAEAMTTDSQWINVAYTVTFDSQGGSAVTGLTRNWGGKVVEPAAPTKAGFTFSSWYKEAACTNLWNFSTDFIIANTILYAKWVAV